MLIKNDRWPLIVFSLFLFVTFVLTGVEIVAAAVIVAISVIVTWHVAGQDDES